MKPFRIGVMVESFRLPLAEGLEAAKALGADGVQIYSHSLGALVDGATRRAFRSHCSGLGLEISAIVGDLGGHGLEKPVENPARVADMAKVVDLAADLGVRVVTGHIGVVPSDSRARHYPAMVAAGRSMGSYAARQGVTIAIETGPEKAVVLKRFLDDVGSRGLGVNLDPANLVMVTADDPVQAVSTLADYIVHTHAKDGVQLQPCDPNEVYGAFASGGFAKLEARMGKLFQEVPLGKGGVPWKRYLAALRAIGFAGYLTVEREVGANPAKDIATAVRFLRKNLAK